MSDAKALDPVLDRLLEGGQGRPATEADLKRMELAAPVPPDLRALYLRDAELFIPGFELFEPAIYEDVNTDRAAYGELSEMVFFADDQAEGFFFIDALDLLGLGAGFIYWVDRGLMGADEVVPIGPSLAEFLAILEEGIDPRMGPTLGQRAIERFAAALEDLPGTVDASPPVDRAAFRKAQEERGLQLTIATGEVLLRANGLYFADAERQIHPLDRMMAVAEGRVAVVGHDPRLGYLGVTRGDWQDLPADRLIAFQDLDHPEDGQILGRFADVLTYWIEEARQK